MNATKVLIVDQDSSALKMLESVLLEAGFPVISAPSGKEGLISAWRDRPQAIIVDPNLSDIHPAELIRKLRNDSRTSSCIYIAFSSLTDPEDVQIVNSLEFDHVFSKDAEQVANIMLALKGEYTSSPPLPQSPPPQPVDLDDLPDGKLIVFLSAKGGTGTSSLCANLATCLSDSHPENGVAVVDLVLPIGSIGPLVGYDGILNIVEASQLESGQAGVGYFQANLPRINAWRFQLLAGSPHPDTADGLVIDRIPGILNTLQQGFSYVFVDVGTSLSRITLPVILNADQIVLILSPDQSTVTLTKTVLDYLLSKDLRSERLFPLLNRAVGLEGLSRAEIEKFLRIKITSAIPYMGGNFTLSNNQDMPVVRKFPDDSASIELREVARQIERRALYIRERDRAGV